VLQFQAEMTKPKETWRVVIMDDQIIERNLALVTEVIRFILETPSILDHLPADFRLVILPENDPALSLYNLGLLTGHSAKNRPVVMVRLEANQVDFEQHPPQLYVPVAA
jgi:hypothetical protein